jgi:hypothetical protein
MKCVFYIINSQSIVKTRNELIQQFRIRYGRFREKKRNPKVASLNYGTIIYRDWSQFLYLYRLPSSHP